MGGNAKHMPHIWEHYDATFSDVLNLLERLSTGDISTTEKFDGLNIHFRIDNTGVVRFSRSGADLHEGGFTFSEALVNFRNHPAGLSFIEGCRAIDEAFTGQWWPFGYSGRDWINAEIVFSEHPQLLKYEQNAIVSHKLVTFLPDGNKLIDEVKQRRLADFASCGNVKTVTGREWLTLPPVQVALKNDAGLGYLTEAVDRIKKCMSAASLTPENTLRDFLRYSLLHGSISELRTSQQVKELLADKISGVNKSVRLVDLKKGQPAGVAKQISHLGRVTNEARHCRSAMKPIINTLDSFSSMRLAGVNSVLIENSQDEKNRIMEKITADGLRVSEHIDDYTTERQAMFNQLLGDWEIVESSPAVVEGLTFDFNGVSTKITGGFATLNQLLGLCRYGRGTVPAINTQKKEKTMSLVEWFGIM